MSSFPTFRLPQVRLKRIFVPEKSTVCSLLAFIALLGLQAASVNDIGSLPQDTPPDEAAQPLDSQPSLDNDVAPDAVSDPLNSPYPIPWPWIVEMQSHAASLTDSQIRYYRSQSLLSPDGRYSAYSRIQMELNPNAVAHEVNSMLFLENLETGDLQFVAASAPYARNPAIDPSAYGQPGMIAVLLPIAWSETGDRLLIRGFDSMFGTDVASDYAVIWQQGDDSMRAIAPTNLHYSNAVLLGWSQANPSNILFRAGQLGDEQWPMVAVNMNGYAVASSGDQPVAYGQFTDTDWNGPQSRIESRINP